MVFYSANQCRLTQKSAFKQVNIQIFKTVTTGKVLQTKYLEVSISVNELSVNHLTFPTVA